MMLSEPMVQKMLQNAESMQYATNDEIEISQYKRLISAFKTILNGDDDHRMIYSILTLETRYRNTFKHLKILRPCCPDITKAFDEKFIHMGDYDNDDKTNENINIYHVSAYPEGAVYDEMPIRFCPFWS